MKQLLSIAVIFTMFFIGCSNDVNINNPIENQTTEEFVSHDTPEGFIINGSYTVSKEIDGSKGGFISYGDLNKTKNGDKGSVYAACYLPAGSFSGTKTITISIDTRTCTGTFGPSMTFDKPVLFSALFTGVDFKNVVTSSIKFVYYDKNEVKYEISCANLYINVTKGVLGILNAQLPHFSRYGFLR